MNSDEKEELISLLNCRYGFCKSCEKRFWQIIKELKKKGAKEE